MKRRIAAVIVAVGLILGIGPAAHAATAVEYALMLVADLSHH